MFVAVALLVLAANVKLGESDASGASGASGAAGAPPTPRALQLDACQYFTLDDARTLLGPTALSPGPGPLGGCLYDAAPRGETWPPPAEIVGIVFQGKPASPDAMYDGGDSIRDRPIRGIGRSARWYFYGERSFGMLDVRHGDYTVRVWSGDAAGHNSGRDRANAIAATRLTLARLPAS